MSKTYISKSLREKVARQAKKRCGCCLTQERYIGISLEIDHIIPEALGGETIEENLWLACTACNGHKSYRISAPDPETGLQVPLFNPRLQKWSEHFSWIKNGVIVSGITAIGRATVQALQLNRTELVTSRREWVQFDIHPPKE